MTENGAKFDLAKDPPWWLRFIVGMLGSTLMIAPPFALKLINVNDNAPPQELWAFIIGTGVVLGVAWLISVMMTGFTREDHIWKCFMTSLGIPGIAISLTVGSQLIN